MKSIRETKSICRKCYGRFQCAGQNCIRRK
ncbi:MAG: hypothetical protein ACOVNZ_11275 [Crocinitomicaceae bacterium]